MLAEHRGHSVPDRIYVGAGSQRMAGEGMQVLDARGYSVGTYARNLRDVA